LLLSANPVLWIVSRICWGQRKICSRLYAKLERDERQALLGIPDDEESVIRHYTLSPQDRLQAEVRRRPHNQLGYAIQLCIMRYPGRVLGMDEDPPAAVVAYVAEQLGIAPDVFASYARRIPTRFEHSHRLAKYLGVRTATRDDRRAALLAAAEAASATGNGLPIVTAIVSELRRRGVLLLPDAALEKIGLAGRAIARQRAEAALHNRQIPGGSYLNGGRLRGGPSGKKQRE
jgi:hypothetical protein